MDQTIERLRAQINTYFIGKSEVVDQVLTCLLAGGHILLEDIPGVGKTTMALAFSKVLDKCMFLYITRFKGIIRVL